MSQQDNQECPIWPGFRADNVATDSSGTMTTVYGSARAGGDYRLKPDIAKRLSGRFSRIDARTRARLTTMLINLREQGEPCPEVTRDAIRDARAASDLPVHTRADRFLLHLGRLTNTIGEEIDTSPGRPNHVTSLAWTESTEESELEFLDGYLQEMCWLDEGTDLPVVSVEGYSRIAEMTHGQGSTRVFVAMWFSNDMRRTYSNAIAPAVRQAGFEPYIVGEGRSTERIEDEAEATIRESRFVVADFTHETGESVRGSVYYEAGFARGLGKPIIFTAKAGTKPHFNTAHFPHIFWKNDADLEEQLTQRIRNMPQLNAQ